VRGLGSRLAAALKSEGISEREFDEGEDGGRNQSGCFRFGAKAWPYILFVVADPSHRYSAQPPYPTRKIRMNEL
jgi:hypothetical protein